MKWAPFPDNDPGGDDPDRFVELFAEVTRDGLRKGALHRGSRWAGRVDVIREHLAGFRLRTALQVEVQLGVQVSTDDATQSSQGAQTT